MNFGAVAILNWQRRKGASVQVALAPFALGEAVLAERVKGSAVARLKAAESTESAASEERPLRPGQCREYMRRELAREFRGIVRGFVEGAKRGSCQHVKLATELVGTPKRAPKRRKSSVRRLIEEMEAGQI